MNTTTTFQDKVNAVANQIGRDITATSIEMFPSGSASARRWNVRVMNQKYLHDQIREAKGEVQIPLVGAFRS
jgi:hypothetical protein